MPRTLTGCESTETGSPALKTVASSVLAGTRVCTEMSTSRVSRGSAGRSERGMVCLAPTRSDERTASPPLLRSWYQLMPSQPPSAIPRQ